jgi:hypothetical protein
MTTTQTLRRIALQALVVLALGSALIGTAAAAPATRDAPAQAAGQAQDAPAPVHAFVGEGWG